MKIKLTNTGKMKTTYISGDINCITIVNNKLKVNFSNNREQIFNLTNWAACIYDLEISTHHKIKLNEQNTHTAFDLDNLEIKHTPSQQCCYCGCKMIHTGDTEQVENGINIVARFECENCGAEAYFLER